MKSNSELTVRQAAERLGVSIKWVYLMYWEKKLKGRKLRNRILISAVSVEARKKQREADQQWQTV